MIKTIPDLEFYVSIGFARRMLELKAESCAVGMWQSHSFGGFAKRSKLEVGRGVEVGFGCGARMDCHNLDLLDLHDFLIVFLLTDWSSK